MRFTISAEQREFASSLADMLAAADTPRIIRAWAAGDRGPGRLLWSRLAELGVLALALPEKHGGFGATTVDLMLAFEKLGRVAAPGPLVESIAVLPRLLDGTTEDGRLAAIGAGEIIATVALPPWVPFALDADLADAVYIVDAGVDNGLLSRAQPGQPRRSVDGARRLCEAIPCQQIASLRTGAALDAGALATAAQILGAGTALLERATAYAVQRMQFGRPIGSFQAVKHRLANVLVDVEMARPLLFGAAIAFDADESSAQREVSAAKVACTDAAYRAARAALQIHGAIGYTADYDLSLLLTKVRALVGTYGSQAIHRTRVLALLKKECEPGP
jgi:alkylation response protein AidB-like acyl-CoA dehydrogenase